MSEVTIDDAAVEMERMVISALLLDRDAIAAVVNRLMPAAFVSSQYRALYQVVCDLFHRRIPADVAVVWDELQRRETPMEIARLLDIQGTCVDYGYACHVEHYANLVVSAARGRLVADAGRRLIADAHADPNVDPAVAFQETLASLPDLGAAPESGLRYYRDLAPEFGERVMRTWAGEIERVETPTGFKALDRKLEGGLRPGTLTLLGGRPGSGKSALMLEFAHHAARAGHTALIFSAEMTAEALLWRAASEITGMPMSQAKGARHSDVTHQRDRDRYLSMIHEQMAALPVAIDDTSRPTVAQMQVKIEHEQRRGPVGLVVFDHIEIAGGHERAPSEERRVGRIAGDLMHLAKTCGVPVLALSQLSREVERRRPPVPQLADLRYSGSLEADAEVVLFLYRAAYYMDQGIIPDEPIERPYADVIVAKQRNGDTGQVRLRFDGPTTTFHDVQGAAS